eukprot:scaffold4752_cov113-Cylindrotheca_fusiformis.AAC.3
MIFHDVPVSPHVEFLPWKARALNLALTHCLRFPIQKRSPERMQRNFVKTTRGISHQIRGMPPRSQRSRHSNLTNCSTAGPCLAVVNKNVKCWIMCHKISIQLVHNPTNDNP